MIQSHEDYLYYLQCDAVAFNRNTIKEKLYKDERWKFIRSLRYKEYETNCLGG